MIIDEEDAVWLCDNFLRNDSAMNKICDHSAPLTRFIPVLTPH